MDICVYYDERKEFIIDISPQGLDPHTRSLLEEYWSQPILRQLLITISRGVHRLPDVQKEIGHSPSTLHAALQKLVDGGFVSFEMSFKGKKQKILSPRVLCVTKSPRHRIALQKFFQGMWVDSAKTKKIIDQLCKDPDKWWTAEELSVKTGITIDEIELLLSNFDSQMTRALSQFLSKPPFEKRISYRAKS